MKSFSAGVTLGLISLVAGIILLLSGRATGLSEGEAEILMRNVGHHVLLSAGDSSSRVLPVVKADESTYVIRFESPFSFDPDTLVKTIELGMSALKKSESLPKYLVNVLRCSGGDVIYGYLVSGESQETLIPCSGRKQPVDCYVIRISFEEAGIFSSINGVPVFIGFVLAGFVFFGFQFRKKKHRFAGKPAALSLGSYMFYVEKRLLKSKSEQIELSEKEAKLLKIFASHPQQVLERDRLMKEVWLDEGVVVGRSLDMFISRLRKKLQNDPSLQIINIHGKGYRLEIRQ